MEHLESRNQSNQGGSYLVVVVILQNELDELGHDFKILIPLQEDLIELFLALLWKTQRNNILPIPHHRMQLILIRTEKDSQEMNSPIFPHESMIIECPKEDRFRLC